MQQNLGLIKHDILCPKASCIDQCMKQNMLCPSLLVSKSLVFYMLYLEREHVASFQSSDWLLRKSTVGGGIADNRTMGAKVTQGPQIVYNALHCHKKK